jgi:hypothetical protein
VDEEYPIELSIPVAAAAQPFHFRAEIISAAGQTSATPEAVLAAPE